MKPGFYFPKWANGSKVDINYICYDKELQEQEYIDQQEFEMPCLVMEDAHSDDRSERCEECSY